MIQMTQMEYDGLVSLQGRHVWVVVYHYFDDTKFVGAYSSEELAELGAEADGDHREFYSITLEKIQ